MHGSALAQFLIEQTTPEEFEEARIKAEKDKSNVVRPFMSLIGDRRNSTSLVGDLNHDFESLKCVYVHVFTHCIRLYVHVRFVYVYTALNQSSSCTCIRAAYRYVCRHLYTRVYIYVYMHLSYLHVHGVCVRVCACVPVRACVAYLPRVCFCARTHARTHARMRRTHAQEL